jgi:hypothetical protein
MLRRQILALAAVGALSAGACPPAFAADPVPATQPTTQQLLEQIKALQARVEQMETRQNASSSDVAATVDQIVKDAEQRSTSLDVIPFAGNWQGGKFTLSSEDGNYLLHPWLWMQFRGSANHRDDVPPAGGSNFESGFEMRRMKFGFDGHVFSPDTTYLFVWGTNRNTGDAGLEEAWVRQKLSDNWSVRAGQLKDPFAHESLVSAKKLLASERTILTDVFTGGDNYVQGVSGQYWRDALQAEVALTDGANSFNNDFRDFPNSPWDFGVAGRVQYKIFGDWSAYDQFTSLNDKHDLLVVGAGVDWSEGGDSDQILQTADVQYNQTSGLGLYGALYGRSMRNAPKGIGAAGGTNDTFDWGAIAQASYLIPQSKWEPFVRYDYINFDSADVPAGTSTDLNEISLGANYYLHGHDAKFTFDLTYLPGGSPGADSGADVLSSNGDQFLFRGQFQLLL